MKQPIDTVERFYTHAIAIEREAADRYGEFASYYADRGEEVLSGLCANLARLERDHLDELMRACAHLQLPAIDAHDFQWLEAGSPEAPAREFFYRVATPRQLLEVALQAECRALAFCEWAQRNATNPAVRALAGEMAGEERQHVRWVRHALDYGVAQGAVDAVRSREPG
jgi:rubrerythrin